MAKGRTNQPINVVVADEWGNHPAVQELRGMGHRCVLWSDMVAEGLGVAKSFVPDLILHPAAHGWDEAKFEQFTRKNGERYRPFVDAAVKAGRARRRAK